MAGSNHPRQYYARLDAVCPDEHGCCQCCGAAGHPGEGHWCVCGNTWAKP
jgi:hypothetical protein